MRQCLVIFVFSNGFPLELPFLCWFANVRTFCTYHLAVGMVRFWSLRAFLPRFYFFLFEVSFHATKYKTYFIIGRCLLNINSVQCEKKRLELWHCCVFGCCYCCCCCHQYSRFFTHGTFASTESYRAHCALNSM